MNNKYLSKEGITEKYDDRNSIIKCIMDVGIIGGGLLSVIGACSEDIRELGIGAGIGTVSYFLGNYIYKRNENKRQKALKDIEIAFEGKRMTSWDESDIGKIIYCREQSEIGTNLVNKKVIIYEANPEVPNTIRFVEYPFIMSTKFEEGVGIPLGLKSRIGLTYAVKSNKKKSKRYLKRVGDWCLVARVSKNEMEKLERIAKASKNQSYEDLSPQYTFH